MNVIRAVPLPNGKKIQISLHTGWKFLTVLIVNERPILVVEIDEDKLLEVWNFHIFAIEESFLSAGLEYLKTFIVKSNVYNLYREVAPCQMEQTLKQAKLV